MSLVFHVLTKWLKITLLGTASVYALLVVACATAGKPNRSELIPVVVSGYPSVVRLKSSFFGFETTSEDACIVFLLRSSVGGRELSVTSGGLGETKFAVVQDRTCGISEDDWSAHLLLKSIQDSGTYIAVKLDTSQVTVPGTDMEGKILIFVSGYPQLEVPIKIERLTTPSFITAFKWFVGIAIPTLVAFLLALVGTHIKKWRDNIEGFTKFRYENYTKISGFFEDYYPTYKGYSDNKQFAVSVHEKLVEENILQNVPSGKLNKIWKHVKTSNRSKLIEALASAFPEWESKIRA